MAVTALPEAATDTGDLSVWPASTTRLPQGDLAVGGLSLTEAAEWFSTPVHLLDEGEVRRRCRTCRDVFPDTEVLYAAKAFLSRSRPPSAPKPFST